MINKYLLTKFKFILDDPSNFPALVPIQEVNRAYFISRYFIGRKIFETFLACSSLHTTNPFRIERPIKPGADPGFQVRGGALKKIAPSGGRREHFWGISCEKSQFYAGCAPPPPWIRPCMLL